MTNKLRSPSLSICLQVGCCACASISILVIVITVTTVTAVTSVTVFTTVKTVNIVICFTTIKPLQILWFKKFSFSDCKNFGFSVITVTIVTQLLWLLQLLYLLWFLYLLQRNELYHQALSVYLVFKITVSLLLSKFEAMATHQLIYLVLLTQLLQLL